MFGASASSLLGSGKKSSFDRLPFFSAAMLQEGHHFKQDNGLESPPASLDNRLENLLLIDGVINRLLLLR
jgi:hypothetical protein